MFPRMAVVCSLGRFGSFGFMWWRRRWKSTCSSRSCYGLLVILVHDSRQRHVCDADMVVNECVLLYRNGRLVRLLWRQVARNP